MLKDMEYVYAVYQERSFSKAAKKLFISQPALSATIKKVENKINAVIFDRSANPVKLTPAGEFYILSIEKIMAVQHEMAQYFYDLSKTKEEQLTIGSPSYFCIYVLSPLVRKFQEENRHVSVNFAEGGALELSKKLKDEEVDFILDVNNPNERIFNDIVWGYEHILLAVPASFEVNDGIEEFRFTAEEIHDGKHLAPEAKGVDLKVFAKEPFLLLKKGSDLYKRVMSICKKNGFIPRVSMYLDQLLTCYYIACEGKGIACIRDSVTQYIKLTDKLYFYKINDALSRRAIRLYYRKTLPPNSAAHNFLEFMRSQSTV
ncbi:MAG: LysR family transcriptional regulator [Synergistaceae bacterium]|jgi:DNA-binding transcriptional LysR family regulator|nr:LysR family transcriptional regulator [Synergistaceae bacterium]